MSPNYMQFVCFFNFSDHLRILLTALLLICISFIITEFKLRQSFSQLNSLLSRSIQRTLQNLQKAKLQLDLIKFRVLTVNKISIFPIPELIVTSSNSEVNDVAKSSNVHAVEIIE